MSQRRGIFGGASNFGGAQLPTYKQVGQQFQQTKLNLQAENSGKKVLDRDVAKKVIKEITRPIVQCRVRV